MCSRDCVAGSDRWKSDVEKLALGVPRVDVALSMLKEEPLSPEQMASLQALLGRYQLMSPSFGRRGTELSEVTAATSVGKRIAEVHSGKRRLMIVAGGQSGVDRAALDSASELTLPHRGWCPEKRWAEDGAIGATYPMQECDSGNPAVRTELNTIDSDATLVLTKGKPNDGTPLTIERAERHGRPTLVMTLGATPDIEGFWRWIEKFDVRILNIGGPRESFSPGQVYEESRAILDLILDPTTPRASQEGGQESKKHLRWSGRNSEKDKLRASVWGALEENGAGVGEIYDSIPDYVGAHIAAERLSQQPFWKEAKVIKSNPDAAQGPVRYRALRDGKLLYMPVPELAKDYPFVLLDPTELAKKGVAFEEAATLQGALKYGKPVQFDEMMPMDVLCVGCVAVTRAGGRTGKGGGFADLELGIFRELGLVPQHGKIVTTVHQLQVVPNDQVPMQWHDSPLDWIVTPEEAIETRTPYPQPTGVAWDVVQPDQYRDIPFLTALRQELGRS